MSNQVMDFYNNDSNRPFEMSFGQNGKTVGTMRFNGDVMTFEGEADAAAAVFIDMIVKKQSQQWVDAQEKISTSELALSEFFQKTDWVQGDNRFDVIIPWGKHRADVLREYIDHVEAKCAALAAENTALKSDVPMGAIENGRVFADRLEAYPFECEAGNLNMCSDWQELRRCFEHLSEWAMHGQSETPATDAFLAEVRVQAHKEGAHFVANRMLAAWEAGFIDDTAKNAADIARMILTSTEFMADAPEGDFDRSFADGLLEDIAAQLRQEAQ